MERTSKMFKPKDLQLTEEELSARKPTKENVADVFMYLNKDKITYDFIMNTFAEFNGTVVANPYDLLTVPPGKFTYFVDKEKTKTKSNKNEFITTMGLWVFNILLRDFNFSRLFDGYYGNTITDGEFGGIEKILSYALIEDEITTIDLKDWENTLQWMMPFETVLSPAHTEKMITCTKVINKKKEELVKKYKNEIESGDAVAVTRMEKELLDYAKEYIGDDPSMDIIESEAVGDWGNNFKNMYVMRGVMKNPDPNAKKTYDIVLGSYMDGIPADEYSLIAGGVAYGAYSRSKKTEVGGYYEKLFVAAFQHIQLDEPGSDCHTKNYITVNLDKKNIDDYMYMYIVKDNGSLDLLTSKNRSSYIGKKVKFRFSAMCQSTTGICNKCAGELFYKLNNKNIGTVMAQIPDTMKLRSMKSFHDSIQKFATMDPMKAFYPFD